MNSVINIIIADDHELFVEGLELLLKANENFRVIAIANDGKELLDMLDIKKPDLILLDINMPKINGLEILKFLKHLYPSIKTLVLSTYSEIHLIQKSKELGANGYLLKNSTKEQLVETINLICNGSYCFSLLSENLPQKLNEFDSFLKQFNLTKREFELLGYIKNELTNSQIAKKLNLSIYTIETHRKNIMIKLELNSRAGLMKFILSNNI